MTRVSIVIPVYNGANYLAEAIDSALAQTDVEVLVIDDGSTDATPSIAKSYGDRIRYIAKPNGGVSSALNRGIAEMRGDYFCWLSHDDRYLPEKSARQLAFFDAHPEARIAGCDFEIIDGGGGVVDVYHATHDVVRSGFDLLETWVFGCALMIHRSCLDVPFNEANRTTQDLEMWLHLVSRHPIHWVPEVLCQLREHAAQGSRTESRYGRDKDELFARTIERYDIAFFDPAATTPPARAAAYRRLAEDAMRRQSWRGATLALARAWEAKRSPWLLMARALGPRRLAAVRRARGFVVGKGRNLLRRVARMSSRA
jgi:glycosyltransferase involved in cell wall biosynthesis